MDREPGSFIADKKGNPQPNMADEAMTAKVNNKDKAKEVAKDADE